MNNYPEWQKTAREASKEHDNAVMLEQRAANAKKNEERTQKLREFLAEAERIADARYCFIEANAMALDGSDRYW